MCVLEFRRRRFALHIIYIGKFSLLKYFANATKHENLSPVICAMAHASNMTSEREVTAAD